MTQAQQDRGDASSAKTTITFVSACLPPLDDGQYSVQVEQSITGLMGAGGELEPDQTFTTRLDFTVAGPRFALDPADVYGSYPPPGASVAFQGQLPHVVFTRKTLPWERTIAPSESPQQGVPWLALLVLHDADGTGSSSDSPTVQSGTVNDLLDPSQSSNPNQVIRGPSGLTLDSGESGTDPCRYIDLPFSLFQDIAPQLDELRFLAHARIVEPGEKPEQDVGSGEYSVLVANRLPKEPPSGQTVRNTALAVSLEGFEDILPPNASPETTIDLVRVAVLHTWSFFMGGPDPFETLFSAENTGLLSRNPIPVAAATSPPGPRIHVEPPDSDASPDTFAEDTVRYALNSGYAALRHHLRDGGTTVSWYRGPLIPNAGLPFGEKDGKFNHLQFADEALRYNPTSGMFDTTYAAALQLGRLLALQNPSFGRALRAYLSGAVDHAYRVRNRQTLSKRLAALGDIDPDGDGPWHGALAGSLARMAVGAVADGGAPGELVLRAAAEFRDAVARRRVGSPLGAFLADPENLAAVVDGAPEPGPSVVDWLAELTLLYGVPFEYLIPDEAMLPMESIRFFYVDQNWVERLLDGALSIAVPVSGASGTHGLLPRLLLETHVKPAALGAAADVRAAKTQQAPSGSSATIPVTWPLAGFLIRSEIVSGWRGIEVRAEGSAPADDVLPPLRFERIGPTVLLGLYNGPIGRLSFKHPPESFHFGVDGLEDPSQPTLDQKLRQPDSGGIVQGEHFTVVLRQGATATDLGLGVLDVTATVQNGQAALQTQESTSAQYVMTPAEFAIQMVEGPEEVVFTFSLPSSS